MASGKFLNTCVLVGYWWHVVARLWQTPGPGGVERMLFKELGRANPGLSWELIQTIAGHLLPHKTRRAVFLLYRSLRSGDMGVLAARLREHDSDALVGFVDADAYIPAL